MWEGTIEFSSSKKGGADPFGGSAPCSCLRFNSPVCRWILGRKKSVRETGYVGESVARVLII